MMTQQQPQQQISVPADQKITVVLSAGIWSQIITVLQEAPISWLRAQPLIMALGEQLQQGAEAQPSDSLPNGHDRAAQLTQ